jgi:hypothetical protein
MRNEDDIKNNDNIRAAYEQLCTSYRAIDDFRAKLLGLLPTGTGIFLVIPELVKAGSPKEGGPYIDLIHSLSLPIGAFGFVTALGLFFYEIYGIRKCTHLIEVGKYLERKLGARGQFEFRAPGIGGLINEPFASGLIYPAVLAAWTFLALNANRNDAKFWAALVFVVFVAVSGVFIWWLRRDGKHLAEKLLTTQVQSSIRQGANHETDRPAAEAR